MFFLANVKWWLTLLIHVVSSIPIFMIAYKSGHEWSWVAFVPIANFWLMCDMADLSPWWILLGLMPFVGEIAMLLLYAVLWMRLSENTNKSPWLGLLMLIPVFNIAVAYYMAFYEPYDIRT